MGRRRCVGRQPLPVRVGAMSDRAVFYFCTADDSGRYIREAQHSVASVRERMRDIPAFLFVAGPHPVIGGFDRVLPLPPPQGPLWYVDSTRYFVQICEELK